VASLHNLRVETAESVFNIILYIIYLTRNLTIFKKYVAAFGWPSLVQELINKVDHDLGPKMNNFYFIEFVL